MLSFHSDPAIKEKYLERVRHHREMDNIIQGQGWVDGKGCAVGCTLENYDHSRYPIEIGIPQWLAHLEDAIFEGLELKEAVKWPELFLSSIPIGKDLEIVKHKIAIKRLDRLIELQGKNQSQEEYVKKIMDCLEIIKKCHESEINKNFCDWAEATSAAESAELAARSARAEATSAAESAWSAARSSELAAAAAAWSAARSSARSSELAAESAARSAWSAVESAESAWSSELAAWKKEACDLIACLKEL